MIRSAAPDAWIEDLARRRVAVDSMIFIYHLGADPRYGPRVASFFHALEHGRFHGVASVLVLLETLVVPFRAGTMDEARDAGHFLRNFPNLDLMDVSPDIAVRAAELRAAHDLRAPDALHAATALVADADAMLTNDRAFRRLSDLDVLYLDDLL